MRSTKVVLAAVLIALAVPGAAAAADTTVSVDAASDLGTIPATGVGMNAAVYDGYMNDAPVPGLMKAAGVGAMRYPGGSYADIYHWKTHTTDGGYVAPGTDFATFAANAKTAGGQPIVTVNYGSGTADEAAGWVRDANVTHDYGVTYWEVGNEVYGNGHYGAQWERDDHADKSPTAYANNVVSYADAMKAADPSIKVGVVLTTPGYWPDAVVGSGDAADWNHTVLPIVASKVDFVVVHWYPGSGLSEADMLATPSKIAGEVSTLRGLIDQYAGSRADDIGIAVTEMNSSVGMNTQPGALYAADTYMSWLENGVFNADWWNLHNGIGTVGTVAGHTDYGDQGVLSNASCTGGTCEPAAETPFAPYYGIQMLGELGAPGDEMVRSSSSSELVSAHAVRRADGDLDVLLINKDPSNAHDVSLAYTGFTPSAAAPAVYRYGNGDTSIGSGQSGTAAAQTLPPYSLTTIRMHAS